jgi:hypothetical protein
MHWMKKMTSNVGVPGDNNNKNGQMEVVHIFTNVIQFVIRHKNIKYCYSTTTIMSL